ncbi:MAG: ABC transporter ATP-binding protein [Candidatus Melainabacteria bacterium RIFOXYA12_FULL_32_12]|nr:MAG: ABC transporter ATP-binding protein [Candidatus Melainabacteria bacterium RIFOXYA2_FULL_32_9]OGI25726.1 MAG: ABC transporter ATP-binding protein [Candidatus Melainabacteria bacterium RIFOXYA12_FULL_32_12]
MPDTLIKLDNVTKIYSGIQPVYAIRDINLTISKGEFISIVGPSGSGKSTLMNVMGLLDTTTFGKLYYLGQETSKWNGIRKAEFRNKEIGFIFQAHLLLPEFTALENVLMPVYIARNLNKEKVDYAKEILDSVGLSDKMYIRPTQLSGGQNQRVAIARALMNKPSVVFADEPTGALDQKTANDIYNLFRKINSEAGMTFIIVTHERDLAQKADRLIQLVDGYIVSDEKLAH